MKVDASDVGKEKEKQVLAGQEVYQTEGMTGGGGCPPVEGQSGS